MNTVLERKERNSGIELLRIVATFAIMALHVLGQGGVLGAAEYMSKSYEIAWLLETLCFFGVTAYGLISGYVGVDGNYKITNIIYTWLQVFLFNAIGTIMLCAYLGSWPLGIVIKAILFPVLTESYWYFTAYFGLFFLIPVLNLAFKNLKKQYLKAMVIISILLFSVGPIFIDTDAFGLREGLSVVWLITVYIIGAYVKKYNILDKFSVSKSFVIFLVAVVLSWGAKFLLEKYVISSGTLYNDGGNILISYTSPTILIASLALISLFSKLNIGKKGSKWINRVAALTFGVYLVNCSPYVWNVYMPKRFADYAGYPVWKMLLCVLVTALYLLLVGIAIDGIRFLIFELFKLRERLAVLNEKIMLDKCPVCGKRRLEKFEICDNCGWENDPVQRNNPDFEGGANKQSLNEYKEAYENNGASGCSKE